ncbi:sensor histidine kinase [Tumebacillus permanentifrigoris]|uniref:histidine kinase n=1 Tax=Tumebacillus permanentifrigoris TaxID=378543 RepID=A0A316DZF2_9BACL|nr:histidine kinase [Tumebacillus permanentifrigoris]PWK15890.1 two-component system nitrate/nitrite sensor histidine kinase NarX [Tumebacillus permanentifrigoris]
MTYTQLRWFSVLTPALLVGYMEYLRHQYLLPFLSMEQGNVLITFLVLVLSFFYATWVFRTIRRINNRLVEEQARRAVYEERERMARELHDGIAQTLFFLNVKLKQGKVEEARSAVAAIDNHVRQAIFNLRDLPEEGDTLTCRLEKWLGQWSALTGIEVQHEFQKPPEQLFDTAQEVQIFGIVQEAFNNIRKHAQATTAQVRFAWQADRSWQLVIEDNGRGIEEAILQRADLQKYGLRMMAERAEKLHADFTIRQSSGGGTELTLTARPGGTIR